MSTQDGGRSRWQQHLYDAALVADTLVQELNALAGEQSEKRLALFWSTIEQQFDFSVTFLSIHRDEKCGHLPG